MLLRPVPPRHAERLHLLVAVALLHVVIAQDRHQVGATGENVREGFEHRVGKLRRVARRIDVVTEEEQRVVRLLRRDLPGSRTGGVDACTTVTAVTRHGEVELRRRIVHLVRPRDRGTALAMGDVGDRLAAEGDERPRDHHEDDETHRREYPAPGDAAAPGRRRRTRTRVVLHAFIVHPGDQHHHRVQWQSPMAESNGRVHWPGTTTRTVRRVESVSPPMVVALSDPETSDPSVSGAKAANLARAAAAGFPTLPGFVITTAGVRIGLEDPGVADDVRGAFERLCAGSPAPLVVRSSSVIEDIGESSMAGRFTSVLDVVGWDAFLEAADRVMRSAATVRDAKGDVGSMAVLVQRQSAARLGGVMFGVDPVTGNRDTDRRRGRAVRSGVARRRHGGGRSLRTDASGADRACDTHRSRRAPRPWPSPSPCPDGSTCGTSLRSPAGHRMAGRPGGPPVAAPEPARHRHCIRRTADRRCCWDPDRSPRRSPRRFARSSRISGSHRCATASSAPCEPPGPFHNAHSSARPWSRPSAAGSPPISNSSALRRRARRSDVGSIRSRWFGGWRRHGASVDCESPCRGWPTRRSRPSIGISR